MFIYCPCDNTKIICLENNNMLNNNENLMDANTLNQKAECQLVLHPNNNSIEHNQLKINIQLFENIQLKYLIDQFEEILNKVKQHELNYLLQPTQIATFKLKELQKLTEDLACDYYENQPCADKNCCNDLQLSRTYDDSEENVNPNASLGESCKCYNTNKKMITAMQAEKKNNHATKCNPCKCSLDSSGKKVKTLECKLASKARKYKRNEAEMFELNNALKSKRNEMKLPLSARRSTANILCERRISNSKIEIQTNLRNFNLNLKKENTAIQDITYQNAREKNQAISCNLSSESSSEDYYSDSSIEQISYSKRIAVLPPRRIARSPTDEATRKKDGLQVECCGCGQRVETIKVDENETCPCGCGDMTTLPEGKYVDRSEFRCDNCGVLLTERCGSRNKKSEDPKACDKSGNASGIKKQPQEFCLIPYSDLKVDTEASEEKCYGADQMVTDLREFLKLKNNYHTITHIPGYYRLH